MTHYRTIGVIGGMGPAATADFLGRLVAGVNAASDTDHPRVLVDSNPHVPDRNAAALHGADSPGPALAAMGAALVAQGAQVLAMPCNAAHGWADAITAAPFVSMIDAAVAEAIAPHLAPGCIVTDVGSTKQSVIRDVGPLIPAGVHFVPAHPVAGTEYSGPDAGFTSLFQGRWCLLTPPPGTDEAAVEKVSELWRRCGSMVESMEAGHHDRVLAIVSHLPHLIAFTICNTAEGLEDESRQEVLKFSASGFRDFTRIAASDPVMWRDIFLNNREALLEMLARFMEDAQAMARAVRWGDPSFIEDSIERGRKIRRSLIELKQA